MTASPSQLLVLLPIFVAPVFFTIFHLRVFFANVCDQLIDSINHIVEFVQDSCRYQWLETWNSGANRFRNDVSLLMMFNMAQEI